ncbi:MAG: lysozyme inhibitor LprI family protein [Gammaproteobacteria bacterium]
MRLTVLGAAALCLVAFSSNAQEMKCPQVFMNKAESTVCQSEELLALDRQMAELYRAVRDLTPNIRKDQKAWSKERKNCKSDAVCIESLYESRIAQFQLTLDQSPAVSGEASGQEEVEPDSGEVDGLRMLASNDGISPDNGKTSPSDEPAAEMPQLRQDEELSPKDVSRQPKPPTQSVPVISEAPSSSKSTSASGSVRVIFLVLFAWAAWLVWKYDYLLYSKKQLWSTSPLQRFAARVLLALFLGGFVAARIAQLFEP